MRISTIKSTIIIASLLPLSLLSACSSTRTVKDGPPPYPVDVSKIPNATPKFEPKSRFGNPHSYVVYGKRYFVLKSAKGYHQRGIASWYGTKFNGRLTSSREPYNMLAMTGASPTLPIPSYVRVTNLRNGRSIIVKINDRGPFSPNRIIDLSYTAAKKLGYVKQGTALVQVTTISVRNPNAAPPVVLTKNPKLYLQIGAFSHFANAERFRLHAKHFTQQPVRIKKGVSHNHPIYRVQIGPLKGVGESDALYNHLQKDGFKNAITVIG